MERSLLNPHRAAAWPRLLVIVTVVAVMVMVSIPLVRQTRRDQWRRQAIGELMLIQEAKIAYALEYNLQPSDRVSVEDLIRHGKYLKQEPVMPHRAPYQVGTIAEQPSCELFGQRIVPIAPKPAAPQAP